MFAERLVHLDLKGAPPRVGFLKELFPRLRSWGATGLLLEWEDMLPYEGELAVARSPRAYGAGEVREILGAAEEAGLAVVPLVQTFGHLEFVLKHRRFAHLREEPTFLMDLCPCRKEARELVEALVGQVLSLHPAAQAVHLGGDEVWTLGSCERCREVAEKEGRPALYLGHMRPLAEGVRARGLRVLVWDDMMRDWPRERLEEVAGLLEPVVWRYREDIEAGLPGGMWERYGAAFGRMWAASSFKGADGPDAVWPDLARRLGNHLSWLRRAAATDFAGIILTGWSRYNHTAPLCELLPAGLPSLRLALAALERGGLDEEAEREALRELGLEGMPPSRRAAAAVTELPRGRFPGAEVFRLAGRLEGARRLLEEARRSARLYFPRYNGGRRDLHRWAEVADRAQRARELAASLEGELAKALEGILDPADVEEFLEAKVRALGEEAEELAARAEALLAS